MMKKEAFAVKGKCRVELNGAYPENLDYLTENYGLNYDSERYLIHYDCFAANVRPSVTIVERES